MPEAQEKFGISELEKLVVIVVKGANTADKMGHESSWDKRLPHLLGFIPAILGLSAVDYTLVPKQVGDIDSSELEQLKATLKSEFDLTDDKLEFVIEDALALIVDGVKFVQSALELAKKAA